MAQMNIPIPSMNLPILIEKNWDRWNTEIKIMFNYQEVREAIEDGVPQPGPEATEMQAAIYKEAKKKDNKAFVDDTHFSKIQNANTAKEAWDILVRSHDGGVKIKKVKLQTLRKQYELTQMEENDKVKDYFTKILTLTNLMKGCGEVITDLIIEKVMRSLPQRFDYIIVAIEESKNVTFMKIEELQSSLEAHEMRLLERHPIKSNDQALKASHVKDERRSKNWKEKSSRSDAEYP
ncbi:hypothetical protein Lal_00049778 [Lupinus albus]|nr:hypothetical protein Lal_00049778 [Lupinus albus]